MEQKRILLRRRRVFHDITFFVFLINVSKFMLLQQGYQNRSQKIPISINILMLSSYYDLTVEI